MGPGPSKETRSAQWSVLARMRLSVLALYLVLDAASRCRVVFVLCLSRYRRKFNVHPIQCAFHECGCFSLFGWRALGDE